ncbi:MAG: hypothetical protein M1837_004463 [Sclerophora amabilis]|nr:MAG: hypothetical protein M1837_004463 [Sclerophora amabilis]
MEVAAAVVSFVTLAAQIVKGIKTLHDFWADVEDAPDDVRRVIDDLNMMNGLLRQLASEDEANKSADDHLPTQMLKYCMENLEEALSFLKSLKVGFEDGKPVKKWSRIKVVLGKTERINKCRSVLGSLKSTLSLAILVKENARNRSSQKMIAELQTESAMLVQSAASSKMTIEHIKDSVDSHNANMELQNRAMDATLRQIIRDELFSAIAATPLGRSPTQSQSYRIQDCSSTSTLASPDRGFIIDTSKPEGDQDRSQVIDRTSIERFVPNRIHKKTAVLQQWAYYPAFFANVHYLSRTNRLESVKDPDDPDEIVADPRQESETSIAIFSRMWLWKGGFILSSRRSGQGWLPSFQLRQVNVRPMDALVFEFSSSGNVAGLRSLFRRGEASFSDVDEEGWTPLHYATYSGNVAVCKLLIQSGASGKTIEAYNTTPLHTLVPRAYMHGNKTLEIARLLIDHGGFDCTIEDADGLTCVDLLSNSERSFAPTHTMRWLLRHPTFQGDPDRLNSRGFSLLMEFARRSNSTVKDFDEVLQLGADINAKAIAPGLENGYTALHLVLSSCTNSSTLVRKMNIIKHIVERGADLHACSTYGETPTDVFWRVSARRDTKLWRDMLLDMGLDLKDVARREIEAHVGVAWFEQNVREAELLAKFESVDYIPPARTPRNVMSTPEEQSDLPVFELYSGSDTDSDSDSDPTSELRRKARESSRGEQSQAWSFYRTASVT